MRGPVNIYFIKLFDAALYVILFLTQCCRLLETRIYCSSIIGSIGIAFVKIHTRRYWLNCSQSIHCSKLMRTTHETQC